MHKFQMTQTKLVRFTPLYLTMGVRLYSALRIYIRLKRWVLIPLSEISSLDAELSVVRFFHLCNMSDIFYNMSEDL